MVEGLENEGGMEGILVSVSKNFNDWSLNLGSFSSHLLIYF